MKLPHFIALAGFACVLFAIAIPHLSALRVWLGFSTFFSLVYICIAIALSLKDGKPLLPLSLESNANYNFQCMRTVNLTAGTFG